MREVFPFYLPLLVDETNKHAYISLCNRKFPETVHYVELRVAVAWTCEYLAHGGMRFVSFESVTHQYEFDVHKISCIKCLRYFNSLVFAGGKVRVLSPP